MELPSFIYVGSTIIATNKLDYINFRRNSTGTLYCYLNFSSGAEQVISDVDAESLQRSLLELHERIRARQEGA